MSDWNKLSVLARVQALTNAAEGKLMDQNVGLLEEWSQAEEKVLMYYSVTKFC